MAAERQMRPVLAATIAALVALSACKKSEQSKPAPTPAPAPPPVASPTPRDAAPEPFVEPDVDEALAAADEDEELPRDAGTSTTTFEHQDLGVTIELPDTCEGGLYTEHRRELRCPEWAVEIGSHPAAGHAPVDAAIAHAENRRILAKRAVAGGAILSLADPDRDIRYVQGWLRRGDKLIYVELAIAADRFETGAPALDAVAVDFIKRNRKR